MACPRIEQAGLKARGKVMASTGANTNGMLLAAVALAGIGWTVLDMRRLRMDVTVRHGTRRPEKRRPRALAEPVSTGPGKSHPPRMRRRRAPDRVRCGGFARWKRSLPTVREIRAGCHPSMKTMRKDADRGKTESAGYDAPCGRGMKARPGASHQARRRMNRRL